MRNSPLAKTPPANLPVIPGVTAPKESNARKSPERNGGSHSDYIDVPQKLQTVTGKITDLDDILGQYFCSGYF